MIGVYLRVSTAQQKNDGQKAAIKRWLKGNGHTADQVRWFEDQESGKTLKRPAFEQLQEAIFNGEVRTVVVFKLDRIARSLTDGVNVLGKWCEQGFRVVSVTQQIDLTGAVGELMTAVLFGLAGIEREYIRERQAAGIAEAKKRGVYQGRRKRTQKADPERAKELRSKGLKLAEIAEALGVSLASVKRYLKSG